MPTCQILKSKVDPRTKKVKYFWPYRPITYVCANEAERANQSISDDFKLKKNFGLMVYIKLVLRCKG